jgi:hypothetical protein
VILLTTSSIFGFDFVIFTTIIGFDFSTFVRLIAFDFHKNKLVLLAPRCAACGGLWTRKTPGAVFVYRYKTLEINKI